MTAREGYFVAEIVTTSSGGVPAPLPVAHEGYFAAEIAPVGTGAGTAASAAVSHEGYFVAEIVPHSTGHGTATATAVSHAGHFRATITPVATGAGVASGVVTFATLREARLISGSAVTSGQLTLAHFDIEVACGRLLLDPSPDRVLSAWDRGWLKRAVCYQARFRADRPELFAAVAVTADGPTAFEADALVVSPLARRALTKLTWTRARSVGVGERSRHPVANTDRIDSDIDGAPWRES